MESDRRPTAYVCQDELMQKALQPLGIICLSFYDVIDENVELTTWREATAVRKEILTLLSRAPFSVRGCQYPEGLIGVYADEFAFVSALVTLRDRLVTAGFERIIFLPSENSLPRIPNRPGGSFRVMADHRGIETLRILVKKLRPYILPILAMGMRRSVFQECIVYRPVESHTRRCGCSGGPIRVLVAATDGPDFRSYYSRPAASIGRACVKEGHQTLIVTNLFASPVEYERHGFKRTRYSKLVLIEILRTWAKALRLHMYASYCRRGAPEGTPEPLWGLACQVVKEGLMARASALTAATALFDEIFARFLPDVLVVIPDGSYFGMAAIAIAKRNGVPSFTALAGQIFDHPQYGFLHADVIAVNNDSAREVYLRHGIPPNRVFVTGMAHYDDTFRLAESLLKSERQTESKVIVFATENLPMAETFEMISPVVSAVLAIPKARVIIRPHPREDLSNYADFVNRYASNRVTMDSRTPLPELLSMADVCVTGFSNVAVEAMILQRPVVCMNLSGKPDKLPYAQEGAALGVHRPQEVGPVLTKALFNEETKASLAEQRTAFLKKQFCTISGDASLRIVKLIEELAKKSMNRGQCTSDTRRP
jgi:hypothetical protein